MLPYPIRVRQTKSGDCTSAEGVVISTLNYHMFSFEGNHTAVEDTKQAQLTVSKQKNKHLLTHFLKSGIVSNRGCEEVVHSPLSMLISFSHYSSDLTVLARFSSFVPETMGSALPGQRSTVWFGSF